MGMCDYGEKVGRKKYVSTRIDYYLLKHYRQLQVVPECVQKFVYPEYFELLKEKKLYDE